ncbi:MAG: hypothetical protein JWL76_1654 [Thermoleophilia bacterium]|nr:hypothetical protein [Thermoleophilia bacterium]
MDHGAVIHTARARGAWTSVTLLLMLLVVLGMPSSARASEQPAAPATPAATPAATTTTGAKLVAPADGQHFDHLEVAPMVQFDPSTDSAGKAETAKWVLLADDRAMTKTVRYCRQFVWATTDGAYHWGCNRWATGADQYGNDQLKPLDAGKVYYWQVVSNSADGKSEVKSAVRAFAIDSETAQPTIADVSAQVHGTAFDDGSYLNLGAAALVNSGVRVSSIHSARLATYAFRITGKHVGAVDATRSYVKVTSAAGTRYLKVASVGTDGTVQAVWRLTVAERKLRTKRFTYQLHLKSTRNGALVKSQQRVVLIKSPAANPKWTPDRTTVKPI